MSGFKAQAEHDIGAVFHNKEEFADLAEIEYNGEVYKDIPIVIDSEIAKERTKASGDNSVGIFAADITVFISFWDLQIMPRKETEIKIGGIEYSIVKTEFEEGEIILDLEMLDE